MSAGCSGCTARWTSMTACHCTLCHDTFTSITNFDRHRNGPPRERGDRSPRSTECHEPGSLGLERDDRGFWKKPDPRWCGGACVQP